MDKKLKNELFRVAVDYLFNEKKVGSQKELAEKIGITEPSLSRVMNGGRTVSDKTLHKMNEAFGGIFNMAYFRGEDPQCMLMEDLAYYKQHPEERLVFEKKPQEPAQPLPDDNTFMMSKVYESFVRPIEAAHAQHVASLEHYIATLEKDKEELLKDKESMNRRIRELESRLSQYESGVRFDNFPFPQGVAEKDDINSTRV
jgi:transcriptional regulator with XRE-family HTH domain